MKLSCALVPTAGVADTARRAEQLGYHAVWLPDSPALYGDVWIALGQIATATKTIGLGTGVIVPSLRHVAVTAAAIAHIEALAPGRLRVAVGTGFTGRRMFGKPALTWAYVERYIRQLKGLLAGEEVEVDGSLAKLMHPAGVVADRPLSTPIMVAASGPKGLGVARDVGDGLMCAAEVAPGAENASLVVMGTALREGESLDSPSVIERVGPGLAVVYHGTYEMAAEAVDGLPGGAQWRADLERTPPERRHLTVHEGHLVEMTERDRRAVSADLLPVTFTDTPAALRDRVSALADQGVSELVFWPFGPDYKGELERMADALE